MREVNERVARIDEVAEQGGFGNEEMTFEFLCECGQADGGEITCVEHVHLTLREYEEVRAQDDRFALAPGHENPQLEHVVRRTDRFVVVDKKPAAEPFVSDDPRGAPSS
jgi:hypothetical protein